MTENEINNTNNINNIINSENSQTLETLSKEPINQKITKNKGDNIESKHLLDVMKKTIEINDYDYKKMLKDFEITERFENLSKKLKKKWKEESKKYQTSIEHMKEYREQSYLKKNNELIKKLKKKDNIWLTGIEAKKKDKKIEKERIIAQMIKKEKTARKNVENYMKEQEKLRLNFEIETNMKCN